MNDRPALFSPRRFRFASKLWKVFRAEKKGEFDRALQLLDEAAEIMPLKASDRVDRALLLLRGQHTEEAHTAFAALRDEFKGSDDPNLQYLRRYCTFTLALLTRSGQWSYEAKEAKLIGCSRSLKWRFPMRTIDEIHDAIPPKP